MVIAPDGMRIAYVYREITAADGQRYKLPLYCEEGTKRAAVWIKWQKMGLKLPTYLPTMAEIERYKTPLPPPPVKTPRQKYGEVFGGVDHSKAAEQAVALMGAA